MFFSPCSHASQRFTVAFLQFFSWMMTDIIDNFKPLFLLVK